MKNITAFYSKRSGRRITEKSAKANPDWTYTLSIDPNFIRGKQVKIDTDGMPKTLNEAMNVAVLWEKYKAKLVRRRAAYARRKAQQMPAVTAFYSIRTGMRVSETYGKKHPNKVESFTLDPAILRKNGIVQDEDGAASNLSAARSGQEFKVLRDKVRIARNEHRKAVRKSKRLEKKLHEM